MPPAANSVSGKISVCSTFSAVASRSASEPGTAAACPANADSPPSTERSANSSTLISVSPSSSSQTNSAGPSTAIAPAAPISRSLCHIDTTVMPPAATSPTMVSASCTGCRCDRGRNASTMTPRVAAPNTISSGASWVYSIFGAVKSANGASRALTSLPP